MQPLHFSIISKILVSDPTLVKKKHFEKLSYNNN